MGHVNTDLVGSASFQLTFDQGGEGRRVFLCSKSLLNFEMGNGVAGIVTLFVNHGLFGAIAM
jgi:hypothetical protein